ncbi:MMS19 nucleotide excision repair protein homolog [Microcaecilia unicolor]|uniref:MMS19 nucleotide excision repair protein n=1 Tax=Microcaecilia unicolor TaxID=1415580 RepID=A0A6P7Y6K6_9AMPH|nr:MMS19 nucleotide excision repair protein homolog [Microcaecilia unicolor]
MAAEENGVWGLVEEFVSGQQDSKAAEVATEVKAGRCAVLQVVEALGSCLASSEPRTRGRGVQLLSKVLLQCYPKLTQKEVEVLVLFYENRLKDHHLIIPHVLQGLKALSMCETLPQGLAVSILKAIFQEVHVQSLMQVDRHTVYTIITNFMQTRGEELKSLGADFTFGFIQVMDGEKDPRNLLVAFQIVQDIIVKSYSLGPFVEELFEVTSCYFPIDFTPPPSDPHGITREDLIVSLRAVLASTPSFAEFLLPLLIEKMDSDLQSAKLDSLQTLNASCVIYGQKELKEFLTSLWSSIRREVFQTASEKIETEGLSVLHTLCQSLSRSVVGSDGEDVLDSFLSCVLRDCKHHLCEPDMKLVWPSTKLLQAAAGASYRSCYKITTNVLPLLLEQYNKHTQSSQRRTILEMLLGFLKLQGKWIHEEEDENALIGFKDSLCTVVYSALTDPNVQLQLVGIKALTVLGSLQGFFSASDMELVVDHLYRLIVEKDARNHLAAMDASGSLARIYPSSFTSRMVPKLSEKLQTGQMESSQERALFQCQNSLRQCCLRALSAVSTHPSIVRETVPLLLHYLRHAQKGSVLCAEDMISVCQSLHLLAVQCQQDTESLWYYHQTVIPCLLALAVQAALQETQSQAESPVLLDENVLTAMVPVISAACSHLSPELLTPSVSQVVGLFLHGDVSFLPENSFPRRFQPFQGESEEKQRRLVALLMAFVCPLQRNVEIPELGCLLQELLILSISSRCHFAYTSASKCFAGLVNKCSAGKQLDEVLCNAMERIESGLVDGLERTQVLTLLLWVTKALVLRYHPLNTQLTDKLISLLVDPELGPAAADGFSLLVSDTPDVLNKACHADIRIMFRQRFFTENVPKLVQSFHAADEDKKPNYLKALSHVLNSLPKQVLMPELPSLLSLLLEALSCPDRVVQLSTLTCLEPLLLDAAQILSLHMDTLVTKLLSLTCSSPMAVRIAALQCVYALTKLPLHVLLPYKMQVIRALAQPLDDKKRLVRKEAVAARGEWFLLGSPGS